ncbi:MAG TPA: ABC transporter permease subunit [Stellaceae bacterium]|nr:ABC transporter permease subunit [Stellaceae bacterium]
MSKSLAERLGPLLVIIGLFLVWQAVGMMIGEDYFPTPIALIPAMRTLLSDGDIWGDLGHSLWRLAMGFLLAIVTAAPLGIVAGRSKAVRDFITPLLSLFYPIPKAALIPIFMLWFGAGDLSKILIIYLSVTLPIVYHGQQGARSVDDKLIWSAQAMGTGRLGLLLRVVLPAALPELLLGVRVALVIGLIVMITSEMIVRQNGLGYYLFNSMDMAQYKLTYLVIVIVGALGLVLDFGFELIRQRLTFWSPRQREPMVTEA